MNASQTTLSQLDSIQRKALTIIGVATLTINSLHHMRQVAASTMQYRMHTNHSPSGLKALLPPTWERRHTTRSCTSMPAHALSIPRAETYTLDRSFLHTDISIWSNLPETTVGEITDDKVQAFKSHVHEYLTSSWNELSWDAVNQLIGPSESVFYWGLTCISPMLAFVHIGINLKKYIIYAILPFSAIEIVWKVISISCLARQLAREHFHKYKRNIKTPWALFCFEHHWLSKTIFCAQQ